MGLNTAEAVREFRRAKEAAERFLSGRDLFEPGTAAAVAAHVEAELGVPAVHGAYVGLPVLSDALEHGLVFGHSWNEHADGMVFDGTAARFGAATHGGCAGHHRTRHEHDRYLSDDDVAALPYGVRAAVVAAARTDDPAALTAFLRGSRTASGSALLPVPAEYAEVFHTDGAAHEKRSGVWYHAGAPQFGFRDQPVHMGRLGQAAERLRREHDRGRRVVHAFRLRGPMWDGVVTDNAANWVVDRAEAETCGFNEDLEYDEAEGRVTSAAGYKDKLDRAFAEAGFFYENASEGDGLSVVVPRPEWAEYLGVVGPDGQPLRTGFGPAAPPPVEGLAVG